MVKHRAVPGMGTWPCRDRFLANLQLVETLSDSSAPTALGFRRRNPAEEHPRNLEAILEAIQEAKRDFQGSWPNFQRS